MKELDGFDWTFRVASTPRSGGGHVARCLTLAAALADLGKQVLFVLDDDGSFWGPEIAARDHSWVAASDAPGGQVPGCVIDGYAFAEETLRDWRARAGIMVALADEPPLPEWADLTVAPSLSPVANAVSGRRVLAGLDYALIEPRYAAGPRPASREVKNILVSFGLSDSLNATSMTLQALDRLPEVCEGDIRVTVAIGASAPHRTAIVEYVQKMKNANCRINCDLMPCYQEADFAVGGGGVSLLERMAQGLPSVSVVLADNQARQIAYCAKLGGTLDAGSIDGLDTEFLAAEIATLLRSTESCTVMSAQARLAVDGRGAVRCAKIMQDIAGAE